MIEEEQTGQGGMTDAEAWGLSAKYAEHCIGDTICYSWLGFMKRGTIDYIIAEGYSVTGHILPLQYVMATDSGNGFPDVVCASDVIVPLEERSI